MGTVCRGLLITGYLHHTSPQFVRALLPFPQTGANLAMRHGMCLSCHTVSKVALLPNLTVCDAAHSGAPLLTHSQNATSVAFARSHWPAAQCLCGATAQHQRTLCLPLLLCHKAQQHFQLK